MRIPEYYPPARVEPWLTLPRRLQAAIDEDRLEHHFEPGSTPIYPRARPYKPFVDEFGHAAGVRWGLDWETLDETMKRVWTGAAMEELFYSEMPFLSSLEGGDYFARRYQGDTDVSRG